MNRKGKCKWLWKRENSEWQFMEKGERIWKNERKEEGSSEERIVRLRRKEQERRKQTALLTCWYSPCTAIWSASSSTPSKSTNSYRFTFIIGEIIVMSEQYLKEHCQEYTITVPWLITQFSPKRWNLFQHFILSWRISIALCLNDHEISTTGT